MSDARRPKRVGEVIHATLCQLLAEHIEDPALRNVTITEVRINADLRSAKVFWSGPKGASKNIVAGLRRASGLIRRHLGDVLKLRYVPELVFFEDCHAQQVEHLMGLFEDIKNAKE